MKKTVILSALAFAGIQANAQVSDISVTLQPTASYNWFDKETAIEDGLMVGGRVGFGFGEAFELRATYEKSVDLKNTADDVEWLNSKEFDSRDVEVERIGGEMKANIPTNGSFAPYLTLGSGVQKLKVKNYYGVGDLDLKSEQIYASGGLGVKVNLGDRLTLNVEGKNTFFNMSPTNVLYKPDINSDEDLKDKLDNDDMYNWSVLAGLQLYLGGREPGTMTELDKAYYRKFSGGISGLKLSIEPGMAYINFDDDSNLRDTYLLGGQAGFDLNQYIGLRGFYYQSSEDEELSTDWDKMAIYGGDLVAKLNVSRGLVPYITLGGGYLNVYDDYKGKEGKLSNPADESGYFAKGGLGLTVPVTKNLELFGAANFMYTSSRDADDLQNLSSPDELKQHTMYNAGLRFQFGKNADEDTYLDNAIDERVDARTSTYQSKIDSLEKELKEAYKNNDADKAVEVIKAKKELESKAGSDNESRIRMTPQELESLVEKVIKGVDEEDSNLSDEERIDRLEMLLLESNRNNNNGNNNNNGSSSNNDKETSQKILEELRDLNAKVDRNANRLDQISGVESTDKTVIITNADGTTTTTKRPVTTTDAANESQMVTTVDENNKEKQAISKGMFLYEGMSVFAGAGFGDDTAPVIGIRGHYSITNSSLEFMPDIYLSPSSDTGFGINANAIYTFDQLSRGAIVKPYLGVGLGYNAIGDTDKFGTNIIIGTSFDVLGGNLYADYTARGFVDINQIAVGYKFGF